MSTSLHGGNLARFLGPATDANATFAFQYASERVIGMLPTGNPLNPNYTGKCRFHGAETDHLHIHTLIANDMAKCYAGAADRLPMAGEAVLIDVLPSCAILNDVKVLLSVAGTSHRYVNPVSSAEGSYLCDLDPAATEQAVSICEDAVPA